MQSSSNSDEQDPITIEMFEATNKRLEQKLLQAKWQHKLEKDLFEKNFQRSQQEVTELTAEMANQRVEYQKKIQDLEVRMLAKELLSQKMVKDAEQQTQMARNELEETIKANQQEMEEFCKEMAKLRVENRWLKQQQGLDLEQEENNEMPVKMATANAEQPQEEKLQEKKEEEEAYEKMEEKEEEETIQPGNQQKVEEEMSNQPNWNWRPQSSNSIGTSGSQSSYSSNRRGRWIGQMPRPRTSGTTTSSSTAEGESRPPPLLKPEPKMEAQVKSKRLINNPAGNHWIPSEVVTISEDGLSAINNTQDWLHVFAEKAFLFGEGGEGNGDGDQTAGEGRTIYYYEAKHTSSEGGFDVGLSPSCTVSYRTCITRNGTISVPTLVGRNTNSYAIQHGTDHCYLSGVEHQFELPREAIKPCWQDSGNVIGCGILLLRQQSKEAKISIFFTLNGHLIGNQIPITPWVDRLYPTVSIWNSSFATNFGDNPAKPFRYDVDKCPGLIFE